MQYSKWYSGDYSWNSGNRTIPQWTAVTIQGWVSTGRDWSWTEKSSARNLWEPTARYQWFAGTFHQLLWKCPCESHFSPCTHLRVSAESDMYFSFIYIFFSGTIRTSWKNWRECRSGSRKCPRRWTNSFKGSKTENHALSYYGSSDWNLYWWTSGVGCRTEIW